MKNYEKILLLFLRFTEFTWYENKTNWLPAGRKIQLVWKSRDTNRHVTQFSQSGINLLYEKKIQPIPRVFHFKKQDVRDWLNLVT